MTESKVQALDCQFARLHRESNDLIEQVPAEWLYRPLPVGSRSIRSFGEAILRSAATVEQTFGGITANLWDDPFEWTLPENLDTREKVREYLEEVEATRQGGFKRIQSDQDFDKEVMAPGGAIQLGLLLLDTLERATEHQGRARSILHLLLKDVKTTIS